MSTSSKPEPGTTLRPCRFSFDGTPAFEGFAYGTTWNGFDNVAVTPEVAQQVSDHFRSSGDPDTADDIAGISPDKDGLVSLAGGYATQIVSAEDGS